MTKMSMSARLVQRALLAQPKSAMKVRTYKLGAATSAKECLINLPETKVSTLNNGFRIATENNGMPTATVGVYIDAGSRYETDENNGVAHFFEHMCFKGTDKRTQTQLELEVENMGAQLHAYTSREQTVYYSKCLAQDVDKVVEILADILQHSKLEQAAIEREKGVILREMDEIEQNHQEVVFDHMHQAAYQGTPLQRTILGPSENVKAMTRAQLVDYVQTHYKPPRMVLAGAGGVDHHKLVALAEKHFGKVDGKYEGSIPDSSIGTRFTGSELKYRDDSMPFAYGAVAVEGVGWSHPDSLTLQLANLLLGSWDRTHGCGANSPTRLAQMVGFGQEIQSYQAFTTMYKDTGLWGIYFVCNGDAVRDFTRAFQGEWKHLCTSVSDEEVQRGKNLLKTQLLLTLDGTTPTCEDIGRQMLVYGRRIPPHEIEARIDSISADSLRETCMRLIYDRDVVIAGVGDLDAFDNYVNIRQRMSWWRA